MGSNVGTEPIDRFGHAMIVKINYLGPKGP
jgi:hypothetical protein